MEKKKTNVKDEFEICYEYLPITIWVKKYEASRYEPAEYEEREIDIDYDYSLDEDEVLDYFADYADSYEELKGFETNEEFQKYLEEHVDSSINTTTISKITFMKRQETPQKTATILMITTTAIGKEEAR